MRRIHKKESHKGSKTNVWQEGENYEMQRRYVWKALQLARRELTEHAKASEDLRPALETVEEDCPTSDAKMEILEFLANLFLPRKESTR